MEQFYEASVPEFLLLNPWRLSEIESDIYLVYHDEDEEEEEEN